MKKIIATIIMSSLSGLSYSGEVVTPNSKINNVDTNNSNLSNDYYSNKNIAERYLNGDTNTISDTKAKDEKKNNKLDQKTKVNKVVDNKDTTNTNNNTTNLSLSYTLSKSKLIDNKKFNPENQKDKNKTTKEVKQVKEINVDNVLKTNDISSIDYVNPNDIKLLKFKEIKYNNNNNDNAEEEDYINPNDKRLFKFKEIKISDNLKENKSNLIDKSVIKKVVTEKKISKVNQFHLKNKSIASNLNTNTFEGIKLVSDRFNLVDINDIIIEPKEPLVIEKKVEEIPMISYNNNSSNNILVFNVINKLNGKVLTHNVINAFTVESSLKELNSIVLEYDIKQQAYTFNLNNSCSILFFEYQGTILKYNNISSKCEKMSVEFQKTADITDDNHIVNIALDKAHEYLYVGKKVQIQPHIIFEGKYSKDLKNIKFILINSNFDDISIHEIKNSSNPFNFYNEFLKVDNYKGFLYFNDKDKNYVSTFDFKIK